MIPVEKNKQYIIDITDISSEGSGIGRIDGYTVFVVVLSVFPPSETSATVRNSA